MFEIQESERAISFTISSEIRYVERIIHETESFCVALEVTLLEEFKIVIRELLFNAIEHGNLQVAARKVVCIFELLTAERFQVSVEDEGEGFDYAHMETTIPEYPKPIRHRGYSLIHEFSEEIRFNETGNRVCLILQACKPRQTA